MSSPFNYLTLMQFAWAFLSITGFSIRSNLSGSRIPFAALGGGMAWAAYLIVLFYSRSPLLSIFVSTILVCTYSELVAPALRVPVSVLVICSIIPLVPGSGLYYSMRAYLNHDMAAASTKLLETLLIAGTISVGIAVVSSVTAIIHRVKHRF